MFGQSGRRSRSRSRKFVTKSLTSEGGNGLMFWAALVFVLSDRLRDRPLVACPVIVEACDVERDMLGPHSNTCT